MGGARLHSNVHSMHHMVGLNDGYTMGLCTIDEHNEMMTGVPLVMGIEALALAEEPGTGGTADVVALAAVVTTTLEMVTTSTMSIPSRAPTDQLYNLPRLAMFTTTSTSPNCMFLHKTPPSIKPVNGQAGNDTALRDRIVSYASSINSRSRNLLKHIMSRDEPLDFDTVEHVEFRWLQGEHLAQRRRACQTSAPQWKLASRASRKLWPT